MHSNTLYIDSLGFSCSSSLVPLSDPKLLDRGQESGSIHGHRKQMAVYLPVITSGNFSAVVGRTTCAVILRECCVLCHLWRHHHGAAGGCNGVPTHFLSFRAASRMDTFLGWGSLYILMHGFSFSPSFTP